MRNLLGDILLPHAGRVYARELPETVRFRGGDPAAWCAGVEEDAAAGRLYLRVENASRVTYVRSEADPTVWHRLTGLLTGEAPAVAPAAPVPDGGPTAEDFERAERYLDDAGVPERSQWVDAAQADRILVPTRTVPAFHHFVVADPFLRALDAARPRRAASAAQHVIPLTQPFGLIDPSGLVWRPEPAPWWVPGPAAPPAAQWRGFLTDLRGFLATLERAAAQPVPPPAFFADASVAAKALRRRAGELLTLPPLEDPKPGEARFVHAAAQAVDAEHLCEVDEAERALGGELYPGDYPGGLDAAAAAGVRGLAWDRWARDHCPGKCVCDNATREA
jgi:hypothetical protein